MMGLEKAQTIAVLFGPVTKENLVICKNFLKDLRAQNKKVYAIGYYDNKELPDYCVAEPAINFITKNDISWLYRPKSEIMEKFTTVEFDMLISLNTEECIPIDYMTAKSNSKFKVGRLTPKTYQYDFMIDISKNNTMEYLIENIVRYLSMIKN